MPSQLLANFIGSVLDNYVINELGIKWWVRFVDDFMFVMLYLIEAAPTIEAIDKFLRETLCLCLHPKKKYLQHYSHGVAITGAVVKPGRTYISNRTVGAFIDKIKKYEVIAKKGKQAKHVEKYVSTINSYLGFMLQHKSYRIRRKLAMWIYEDRKGYLYFANDFKKAVVVKKYQTRAQFKVADAAKQYDEFLPIQCSLP